MTDTTLGHETCTVDDNSPCGSCSIHGKIACKWDKTLLAGFHAISIPPTVIGFAGVAFGAWVIGSWWYLIGFGVYFFAMLGVFEIRFLCSHCPYYAKPGKKLECIGNHGSMKFWKYNPGPMNRFEQTMMVILVNTLFILGPLGIVVLAGATVLAGEGPLWTVHVYALAGFAVAILASGLSFKSTLRRFFCSVCVNFSCPYNTVPKHTVDAYLRRNPVMRDAWERSGYGLGSREGAQG